MSFLPIRLRLIPITLLTLLTVSAGPSAGDWKASEVVTSYVNGTSPTLILGFDNNLEICLTLRRPMTPEELAAAGVAHTRSQLVLLQLWALTERLDDGRIRCTLPVIDEAEASRAEELADALSERVLAAHGERIDAYLQTVVEAGWPEHRMALLGSFVLDGLVWQELERLGAIEDADPAVFPSGSDYWSGVSWIVLPPRATRLGTNSHRTEHGTLYTSWTPASLEAQKELLGEGLPEELISATIDSSPVEHAARLEELGLVVDGRVEIPAIVSGDALCVEGRRLASKLAGAVVDAPELGELMRLGGATDRSASVVIAYHWIYPALLARLRTEGLELPAILAGEPGASVAPSLFVVGGETGCSPGALEQ